VILTRPATDSGLPRSALAFAFAACLLLATPAGAQPPTLVSHVQSPSTLTVEVQGVTSNKGHIRIDVCSRGEFLKEDCRYRGAAPAVPGVTVVVVKDVPPGVYAIQAYHDRNDNGDVDRDFLGFPTEAVGFSNDAPIRFGPPSFRAAGFEFAGGDMCVHLRLRRFHP
jgi:uncharacterized protein (DUF2141 family)